MRPQVVDAYLNDLLSAGVHTAAADLCPSLLGSNAGLWERWTAEFASHGALPFLAALLPAGAPVKLQPATYDLALSALLQDRAQHGLLLQVCLGHESRV